jgi:hypothetical protein
MGIDMGPSCLWLAGARPGTQSGRGRFLSFFLSFGTGPKRLKFHRTPSRIWPAFWGFTGHRCAGEQRGPAWWYDVTFSGVTTRLPASMLKAWKRHLWPVCG